MKRLIWLLLCVPLWAQVNNARMIGPPNYVVSTTYQVVPADATRLTRLNNASGVAVSLPSGLNIGFGTGLVFSFQNIGGGSVTFTCVGCTIAANGSPSSTFILTAGAGADIYSDGQNYTAQTGSGSGGGGGSVSSVFTRVGGISAVGTDYGLTGVQQPVTAGSATLLFTCLTTGTCTFGNSGNFLTMFPTANTNGFQLHDTYGNTLTSQTNSLQGIIAKTLGGTSLSLYDSGEATFTIPGASGFVLDMLNTGATFNVPANFAGTGGFQLNGSFGTPGQVACSTGSAVVWSSSCGGASGVSSVSGTANQIISTGGTTPALSLVGGSGSPLVFPGNLQATQFANSNTLFTFQRKTDTSPTGNFLLFQSAGSATLGFIDIVGNLNFPSLVTTGAGGGYIGLQQGTDTSAACFAASASNGICHLAPTSVSADYAVIEPSAAPIALSVKTSSAASSSETTESYTAVSGSTMTNIVSGVASLAGMGNGVIPVGDGSGSLKSSGVNVSLFLPSIQGPASLVTTTSLTGATVLTYGNTIPASTTVQILCTGRYSFTTNAEEAAFALNFSSAPTVISSGIYIGANPTTQSSTWGLQTVNGALVTSPANASNVNIQLPVRIEAGITTNAATTFTVVGATSSASGTLNIAANGFTCSVK